jgi:DUF1680 family protein
MTDNVVVETPGTSDASERPGGVQGVSAVLTERGVRRPLGTANVRLGGEGLWGVWQERNRSRTIHHTIREVRAAGNLDNLRAVAQPGSPVAIEREAQGAAPTEYRGRYPFLDTDVFKTLEGIAYEIGRGEADAETIDFFEEAVALLESAQQDDGYLNSYFQAETVDKQPWDDLAWGHELYNLGHLIQAAVAASRQMGDRRLLDIASRFADLAVRKLGPDGQNAVDGHPEAEMALVELFRETGDRDYLTLAELLVDRRGHGTVELRVFPAEYFQDNAPFRELDSVTGHAVRMAYLAAGATDVALENGDETLLEASERLWRDMSRTKLYITGGLGSRHSDEAIGDRFELPSERSYSETCAAIATMQWAWRLHLATGDAHYLDAFETVLYNAYAAGLSSDGCAFFYDNPLQRRPDHQQRTGAEPDGEILRRAWFVCPCCPPNIVRWMSELQDYVATTGVGDDENTLFIGQYTTASIDSDGLSLDMQTSYPFEGEVRLTVTASEDASRTIALRVPAWCHSATVTVNGEGAPAGVATGADQVAQTGTDARRDAGSGDGSGTRPADGWLRIEREWAAGDTIELHLDMPVRAHGSHPAVDGTRGAIAIARGPLVFAAEQEDNEVPLDDIVVSVDDVSRARVVPTDLEGHAETRAVAIILPATIATTAADEELYPELTSGGAAFAETAAASAAADTAGTSDSSAGTSDSSATTLDASPTQLALIPYYLWGNREPLTMRVWLRRDIPSVTTERK